MDTPPVAEFRIAQLPVARRRNFGEWVNAVWGDRSAVAVMSVEPLVDVDHEKRGGHLVLTADSLTAYDELEIRDSKMTAGEIYAAFAKARPDLAAAVGEVQSARPEQGLRNRLRRVARTHGDMVQYVHHNQSK